jgi:hypothetical protein
VVRSGIPADNRVVKSAFLYTFLIGAVALYGKDKRAKKQDAPPQDEITVIAHLTLTGGPVTRFTATKHYERSYVYAEHESGKNLTLIDVTDASRPKVLADVAYPDGSAATNLVAATGTAGLVSDSRPAEPQPATPQTIRIMSFSDPLHPAVIQEFKGVTATSREARPGLIFLANADGIWILQQHFAEDPAVEKSYAYKVVYGESMYH